MTVLEAMSVGTSVVAHPVAAVPEMLDDGAAGFLVEDRDEEGWRQALREAIGSPQERERRARVARERVVGRYSLDAMIEGYLTVRDEILPPPWASDNDLPAQSADTADEARIDRGQRATAGTPSVLG